MTIVNRFAGQCLKCRATVAAGAGHAVKVDGKWSCYCRGCLDVAPVAASGNRDATITVKMQPDGRIEIKPASYLGSDLFDRYRDACGAANYDRNARLNRCTVDAAPTIVTKLVKAGFRIDTDPLVTGAIQAYEARAKADLLAASSRSIEVDMLLRARGLSLFPFQVTGVQWLAPQLGAILADDMGLGKTIQALIAAPANAPIVVVCPAVAKGVWLRECKRWRPDLTPVVLAGRGSFVWPKAGQMVVTNYAILPLTGEEYAAAQKADGQLPIEPIDTAIVTPYPGTTLIADEAHVIKGSKTLTCQRFRALRKMVTEAQGRTWLLTATPILNRPTEMWSLLETIGMAKTVFGSWPKFRAMAGGSQGQYGTDWSNAEIDTPAIAIKLREVMLRRVKTDVLTELPAKTIDVMEIELDSASIKKLDAIEAELAAHGIDLAEANAEALANNQIAFELLSKARAILARAKTAAALELADELGEAGEPVVVFSAHKDPIAVFAARKGWATITGETPPKDRTAIEESFQRGELLGVASTIKAGGVAITLTRSANVLFVDSEWTPKLNEQAEDRCYRIGQSRPVTITYLQANHPIDRRVAEICGVKRSLVARTVDAAKVLPTVAKELDSVSSLLAGALAAPDTGDRARHARELAERVKADREQAERDSARRKAASKAEASANNRGWNVAPQAFETTPREAGNAVERWAMESLSLLAGLDGDHARDRNDMGFNASDTYLGHALAAGARAGALSDGEWSVAIEVASRYPRQVGERPRVSA